jgi:hypothetical protein
MFVIICSYKCKCPVNAIINPNPICSHSIVWHYVPVLKKGYGSMFERYSTNIFGDLQPPSPTYSISFETSVRLSTYFPIPEDSYFCSHLHENLWFHNSRNGSLMLFSSVIWIRTKICVKVTSFHACSLYVEIVICWQGDRGIQYSACVCDLLMLLSLKLMCAQVYVMPH